MYDMWKCIDEGNHKSCDVSLQICIVDEDKSEASLCDKNEV